MHTAHQLWRAAGVPQRHAVQVIHPLGDHREWDRAHAWAMHAIEGGGIIALIGDRGTGKTQLATELVRAYTLKKRPPMPALYIRIAEMFSAIRESYGKAPTVREADVIARFVRPHLLVIDEAHERSMNSDFEPRMLNTILDKRYGEARATIFIANVGGNTPEDQADSFRRQIGETIFDRLSETGGILPCNWRSFRVKGEA